MPAWLTYALIRVGVFAAVFAVLLILGLDWLWSALIATVIAFCLAYVLLRRQRAAVVSEWTARRPQRTRDDEAEDASAERDAR